MSTRADFRRRKKISKRLEEKLAKEVGGVTTAGSGAAEFSGGADVRLQGELRIEHKFTESDTYTLKFSDLEKLRKQAIKGGLEEPVFVVEFLKWGKKFAITASSPSSPGANEKFRTVGVSMRIYVRDIINKTTGLWFRRGEGYKTYLVQPWEDFLHDRAAHD